MTLVETCSECPEQYDVFAGGKYIAYLRLRHGCFRADVKKSTVYQSEEMKGDGRFEDDERIRFISDACEAIAAAYPEMKFDVSFEFAIRERLGEYGWGFTFDGAKYDEFEHVA